MTTSLIILAPILFLIHTIHELPGKLFLILGVTLGLPYLCHLGCILGRLRKQKQMKDGGQAWLDKKFSSRFQGTFTCCAY